MDGCLLCARFALRNGFFVLFIISVEICRGPQRCMLMLQIALLGFCLCSLYAPLMAQEDLGDRIEWSASRKLAWSDYKGQPDPQISAAASTTTYLSIEYEIENGKLLYFISSTFSPARSWVRHPTDHVLGHEQGHFDIAELYARRLHQRMLNYRFDRSNFREKLENIYQTIQKEKDDLQNQYDRETDHSRNEAKQKEWEEKIRQWMKETDSFAQYPKRGI